MPTNESTNESTYDAHSVEVLKGLEPVKKRPGMFIGDTGNGGLHHLVKEIVANSTDEKMAGHCSKIRVEIAKDGSTVTVEDNGRGIPVAMHATEKKPSLEVVLGSLHAGGKFNEDGYKVSGGLHGVGASCVNALSIHFKAVVKRDGGVFEVEYSQGDLVSPTTRVRDMKKREATGTLVTYTPDPGVFKAGTTIDDKLLISYLRECAFLCRGLRIDYINKSTKGDETFEFSGGVADYVAYLAANKNNLYPKDPIYFEGVDGRVSVEVAIQYSQDDGDCTLSFANNVNTMDGGTHLSGFRGALTRVVNNFYKEQKKDKDPNLAGDDIRDGLTAIISVLIPQPEFVSQTKNKLGSVEVEGAVSGVVLTELTKYFEKNPAIIKTIIDRALLNRKAREAAKKQMDLIKRKSVFGGGGGMPDKLWDCRTKDPRKSELYLVEGASAGGSAKGGRNAETMAILPLRGKVINAEKHGFASLIKNAEIQSMIKAIGVGVNEDFNMDGLRYYKVIIMADADDDGCHIAALLMTFFFRYMKPLITAGHLYLAVPPLYKVKHGKTIDYAWTDKEVENITSGIKGKTHITRFKGLGEMNEEELGYTTMDPENRRLIRLDISDMGYAEQVLTTLMGSSAEARKIHIKGSINSIVAPSTTLAV